MFEYNAHKSLSVLSSQLTFAAASHYFNIPRISSLLSSEDNSRLCLFGLQEASSQLLFNWKKSFKKRLRWNEKIFANTFLLPCLLWLRKKVFALLGIASYFPPSIYKNSKQFLRLKLANSFFGKVGGDLLFWNSVIIGLWDLQCKSYQMIQFRLV